MAAQGWEGVRDASSDAAMCAQYPYHDPDHLLGSEDCLYLSVHTRHAGLLDIIYNILI